MMSQVFEFAPRAVKAERLALQGSMLTLAALGIFLLSVSIREMLARQWPEVRIALAIESLAGAAICFAILVAVRKAAKRAKHMLYGACIRLDEDRLLFEDLQGGVTSYRLVDLSGVAVGSRSLLLSFGAEGGESIYITKAVLPEHEALVAAIQEFAQGQRDNDHDRPSGASGAIDTNGAEGG